eukprot:TRINITY_DN3046_c0_g1_i7.p1 TRINITY_DN3046_c0_g1~~TRINITY_DN3046_c0_g1_i7.p1  ORF type:complete len:1409 (-),score=460.73 TRINITY_DN3046_c0_g1_i7:259-4485(-)
MENGVGAVLESRAVENDDQKLGFGDGDARDIRGLEDSDADGVLEEAVFGGDEKVGRSREIDGIGNSHDGVEIERSEEAMDHSLGNGDIVLDPLVERGDPEGEGVVVLTASTASVENGEKVEGVGSLEEKGVESLEASTAAVENGEKEEGVESLEASTAAVENGEKEEGVGSLEASTAAVENGEKGDVVGSLEASIAAVESGEKEEGVASLEASTAVENGEKEKYENGGMDWGAIHAIVPETGEANEGIEDSGKPNDNHRPGKSEDGVDVVEDKMEDNSVLGHPIDDDGVCNGMDDAENSEISPTAELNGVAGHEDGYAVLEASAVVDGKEECDEKSENGVFVVDEKSENGSCDEANSEEVCSSVCEKPENGETDEVNLGEIHTFIREKPGNGVFDVEHCGEFGEQIQHWDESPGMEDSSSSKNAFMEKEVSAVDEVSKNGNHDEANSGEICAGVHEKSDNDDNDEANVGKIHSLIHQKPGNGVYYEVPSGELSEQIQYQNGSPEKKDTSDIAAASVDEKLEASRGKSQPLVGVLTELNEERGAEPDECEAKDWQDSQAQLSGDTQNGCSDHSEVSIRTKELSETEEIRKQDSEPSCAEKSAPRKLLERDFISVEEYDASNSTDEDDTVPDIQRASVVSGSSGNSADPPAPPRPAGLGSSTSVLEPIPRVLQQPRVNGAAPQRQSQLMEDPINGETEEYDETREKLQMIRVKFLRLARRLGQTPHNVVVAQVLYRLGLAEQLRGSRNATRAGAFSFDRASAMAEKLEAASQEPLDFSCTIMVIGKTGVGKSATINSIFDEVKFSTDAFQLGTKKVEDIVGMVQGIKVRVIDTPGLLSSCLDQHQNKKILNSVKNFIKKTPPDIVLYLDRLDMQSRDFGDVPLLRTITDIFGPSIWFNAIVVLTHAASAPPDGPNGTPLTYEMFVTQRSHVVQQAIRQAAGDMRLMNPVSLVENHSACRTNRAGQRVLPNGQVWKPHLLLLSFASKILAEANTLLKLQDSPPGKPFGARSKIPPLPFLLSSLLQSRPQLKLPEEQFGDEENMDDELDESSDSDDESEYNELPPFKRLTKAQLAKLSKEQKRAYFDELDYREKLFVKKQFKEEKRRRKTLRKMAESAKDLPNDYNENLEEESGSATSVPMPDMPLPSSFDSDNPTHRYRSLDNSSQWLVRPVLETHGWDHDVGYEGVNVERLFVVKDKIPVSFSGQVSKDKKESNLQMELASSIKHGAGKATSFGFDMQTAGKDMAYTLRSEVRFSSFRCNKTSAGVSVNIIGDALSAGLKFEDILLIRKRLKLVMSGGAMTNRGDVAYGGTLEATLRDKDYPLGRMLSTLGLSIMDWHGDLAMGCNLQTQFPIGRTTNMITRANLNNKGTGQVSLRLNSSEQLQIALVALVPVFQNIFKNNPFSSSQPMQ